MSTEMPQSPPPAPAKGSGSKTGLIIIVIVLVVIGLPICACGGCIAVAFLGATGMMTSSEPYQTALESARSNDLVIEKLGEPIEETSIPQGSINLSDDSGDCDLTIPIKGPNGSGTIRVRGTKSGGVWTYDEIVVEIGDETIDLEP